MRSFLQFIRYLVSPNPGVADYATTWVIAVLAGCAALIVLSFLLRYWRSRTQNPITKKLSRSWSSATFWFGISGLVLIVCRVEGIQFLAMRLLWVILGLIVLLYLFFQVRLFRARHYEVLPKVVRTDPRDKYLPGKKR